LPDIAIENEEHFEIYTIGSSNEYLVFTAKSGKIYAYNYQTKKFSTVKEFEDDVYNLFVSIDGVVSTNYQSFMLTFSIENPNKVSNYTTLQFKYNINTILGNSNQFIYEYSNDENQILTYKATLFEIDS